MADVIDLSYLEMYSSDLYSWCHHYNRRWDKNIYIYSKGDFYIGHNRTCFDDTAFFTRGSYDRLQLESRISQLGSEWTMRLPIWIKLL
jgi:hypothetical protein